MNTNKILSKILTIASLLVIILAFAQIFATPMVYQWLTGNLNEDVAAKISPLTILNHVLVGILLIPFGISTIFSAIGIRSCQKWAKAIAYTNSIVIIFLPLGVYIVMGSYFFDSTVSIIITSFIVLLGVSMFLLLLWLRD
jgi:uncharacterized membrane protein (DUF2068 family)